MISVEASIRIVSRGALVRHDVVAVGLHGKVDWVCVSRRLEGESVFVFIGVEHVIPGVYVALAISLVTDLEVVEAVADVRVVLEAFKRHHEETGTGRARVHWIEIVRNLGHQIVGPFRIIVAPVPVVAI
jgi:hypothetical protein